MQHVSTVHKDAESVCCQVVVALSSCIHCLLVCVISKHCVRQHVLAVATCISFEQPVWHHVQCVPPPWLKVTSSLSDASLLLQGMVNEHANPKAIKLSCNIDVDADHGEERTGLAVTSPDSTEVPSAPLSGWEDDTSPVPVSPAFSIDCMSCSHIWCFADHVCPLQHPMLRLRICFHLPPLLLGW